jgi:pre-rRNA-processing protein TSR2
MHPNKAKFLEGLSIIMKRWTALQLAVEMEWGGPSSSEKAKDFEESLAEYFENGTNTVNDCL